MLNYASRGCWRGIAEGRVFSSRFWCASISLPFALPKGYQWCCMGASCGAHIPLVSLGLTTSLQLSWFRHHWKLVSRTSPAPVVPLNSIHLLIRREDIFCPGTVNQLQPRATHESSLPSIGRQPYFLQWSLNTRSENQAVPSELVPSLHTLSHPWSPLQSFPYAFVSIPLLKIIINDTKQSLFKWTVF